MTDSDILMQWVSQTEDWDTLLERVSFHRLQIRLYSLLKRNPGYFPIPPDVWNKIESAYHLAQATVLAHEGELRILLPRLNEEGVETLLLKGAALQLNVYQKNPVRSMVDLDLLIHRKDLARTEAILKTMGYQSRLGHLPSRWHEREIFSKLDQAYFPFFHPQRNIHLDLHTEAFEAPLSFGLKPDWLWEDAQEIQVDGFKTFLPSPTHLFLHLLLHLVKHRQAQQDALGWYLDLDESLRYFGTAIDGARCREIIQSSSEKKKILEVLALIQQHLSSPLPDELRATDNIVIPSLRSGRRLSPPSPVILSPVGAKNLGLRTGSGAPARGWSASGGKDLRFFGQGPQNDNKTLFFFYWKLIPGIRKKIWFLVRWFFPDRQYLEMKYGIKTRGQRVFAYGRHFTTTVLKGWKKMISLSGDRK